LRGQRLPLLNRGTGEGIEWVLLQLPDGPVLRIPIEWTDLSIPDPYHLAGRGRASLRVPDLLAMRALIDALRQERRR
jgi:hypothetical protein